MDNRVKELLEKVRSTAGAVGSMAGNTARQAGKYAGELFDTAKLNLRMFDLNNEITTLLKEIGQIIYDTHTGKETEEPILDEK
ncbi:MAG: zinc ribbon domain-containing protein, partial [Oscillospiraceae bacterium]|nr:zinc ribbon domain-containing protein [Oscillospiraceae bacterium]